MQCVYIITAATVCLPHGRKIPFLAQQYFLQFREERDAFAVLALSSITVGLKQVVGFSRGNKQEIGVLIRITRPFTSRIYFVSF